MRYSRFLTAAALVAALVGASGQFVSAGPLGAGPPAASASGVDASRGPLAGRVFSVDTGFRPSADGFAFKNSFSRPGDHWLVRLGGGRCGGMAYAALDHFYTGGRPSSKAGDGGLILRRNLDSLVGNGSRFVLWTVWSALTPRSAPSVTDLTVEQELPALAAALEDGPVPLGLVRTQRLREMKRNHQVVAYGMQSDGDTARIRIYDPNHPQADDVVLVVPLEREDARITSSRGTAPYAAWRGLFVERYAPSGPDAR